MFAALSDAENIEVAIHELIHALVCVCVCVCV